MLTYAQIPEIDGVPPNPSVFRCFEELAPTLLAFASAHSLLIRKYYHNQPMWSFHFLHPKGGFGMVQLHAAPVGPAIFKAAVASHWWIDELEKCQRSSLSTRSVSLEGAQPEEVLPFLERALADLLTLTPADLLDTSTIAQRRRDGAGDYVFSEFERAQRLPT